MSLNKKETEHVKGGHLVCRPLYGWGWVKRDLPAGESLNFDELEQAGPFEIEVEDFISLENERRGFVGIVRSKDHIFSGLKVAGVTMVTGDWNFSDRICPRVDLEIGREYPHPEGSLAYAGSSLVAEAIEQLETLMPSGETNKSE